MGERQRWWAWKRGREAWIFPSFRNLRKRHLLCFWGWPSFLWGDPWRKKMWRNESWGCLTGESELKKRKEDACELAQNDGFSATWNRSNDFYLLRWAGFEVWQCYCVGRTGEGCSGDKNASDPSKETKESDQGCKDKPSESGEEFGEERDWGWAREPRAYSSSSSSGRRGEKTPGYIEDGVRGRQRWV